MQNENINNNSNNEKLNEKELTLETLMAFIIILLYNVVPMLFETYKFHYIHESGLCMLCGLIITISLSFFYSAVLISLYRTLLKSFNSTIDYSLSLFCHL
jgi:hypothetical protein